MSDLSEHLSWGEVLRGSGYSDLDEVPDVVAAFMTVTAREVFEPIRNALGRPIAVVPGGGVREPELNERVGGAKKSQHLFGKALDLRCKNPEDTVRVYDLAVAMQNDGRIPAGGCALYIRRDGSPRFVHVDCRGRRARWLTGNRKKVSA